MVKKDNNKCNLLHDAALHGDFHKMDSLLSLGVPLDSRDYEGVTPLMYAAGYGQLQAVKYLLAKGADPSLQSNKGCNLLHWALQGGDPVIIELMLSHVPSIDSRIKGGVTALMIAALHGRLQAVQYLLEKGADPSLHSNSGWNLLHCASQGDNSYIIELMLSHVPSIDSRNNEGVTALMIAAAQGNLQAVQCLLEKGADPSLQDNDGWNLLHHASLGGHPVIIKLMLSHVPSIDSRNNKGVTALMTAAGHGRLLAVQCLLKKGADPSLVSKSGRSWLHYASLSGNTGIIKEILSPGVDIESRPKLGVTPLMFLFSMCAKPSKQ